MNQDNYLGEAFKMRNLLELFVGDVRIVGFREHIISDTSGLVATFAASNEFVFGTMIQRFMAWPLMVRLHYGHPDVWDSVWAASSGGISKASKTIHVSEDVFGGANVILRGGSVGYTEFIHCGKARDITFSGINQFEQKISGGNALQCMSRDYSRLGANLDLFRLLSLYTTSIGFFLTASVLHTALIAMLLSLISLALCRAETYFEEGDVPFEVERGSVGMSQVYSAEFVLQLGFVKAFPLFVELWVEHGFFAALSGAFNDIFTLKQVFTLFTERTRDFFFDQGVLYGSASYIATGRSFDALTSNFVHLYHLYARSHFYFALKIGTLALLYGSVTDLPSYYGMATWGVWLLGRVDPLRAVDLQPAVLPRLHMVQHFHEFLLWLDEDPAVPADRGKGSWRRWHDFTRASLRAASRARSACSPLCCGSPTWCCSSCAWPASRTRPSACTTTVQATADQRVSHAHGAVPFSRAWLIVGQRCHLHHGHALIYYALVGSRLNLVQVFLPNEQAGRLRPRVGAAVVFSWAYLGFVRWLFSDYLSQEGVTTITRTAGSAGCAQRHPALHERRLHAARHVQLLAAC